MSEVTVLNEGFVEGEDGEMGREHGKWATVQEDMEVDMEVNMGVDMVVNMGVDMGVNMGADVVVNMGADCAESHGK